MVKFDDIKPADIEAKSFEIITQELGQLNLDPKNESVIKRVIHTSADFDYARTLRFSPGAVDFGMQALKNGATIVTDTMMAFSGINKAAVQKLGAKVVCFMQDEDVALEAKKSGTTRAAACMKKAATLGDNTIFAIGNAPTALLALNELILNNELMPKLIIAVPVGFVNVTQSKEIIADMDVAHIVALGRKGGSNVAAAIVNALLYNCVTR